MKTDVIHVNWRKHFDAEYIHQDGSRAYVLAQQEESTEYEPWRRAKPHKIYLDKLGLITTDEAAKMYMVLLCKDLGVMIQQLTLPSAYIGGISDNHLQQIDDASRGLLFINNLMKPTNALIGLSYKSIMSRYKMGDYYWLSRFQGLLFHLPLVECLMSLDLPRAYKFWE